MNAPSAFIQESVRAHYRACYRDLVTGLSEVEGGFIRVGLQPAEDCRKPLGDGLYDRIVRSVR